MAVSDLFRFTDSYQSSLGNSIGMFAFLPCSFLGDRLKPHVFIMLGALKPEGFSEKYS